MFSDIKSTTRVLDNYLNSTDPDKCEPCTNWCVIYLYTLDFTSIGENMKILEHWAPTSQFKYVSGGIKIIFCELLLSEFCTKLSFDSGQYNVPVCGWNFGVLYCKMYEIAVSILVYVTKCSPQWFLDC